MKKYLRPGLALGSGALLALCFPPFNLGWIVWGWMWILLPLLWTSRSEKKRRAGFGIGFLSGLGFWLINLKWIWTVTGLGAVTLTAPNQRGSSRAASMMPTTSSRLTHGIR